MPNIGQIQRGLAAFIDAEVAPKLSGLTRVIVAGGGGVLASRLNVLLSGKTGGMLSSLALVDENGEIDIDVLYNEFKKAIQQTGSVTIEIPIPFQSPLEMTFRDADLDRLYQYIKQS